MLSREALKGIASYQYKAGTYTVLDNILNPFWTKCVEFLPIWMAPNLVTLIGTFTLFISTVVQLIVSPTFSTTIPSWILYLSAFSLFIYQTFDALDGKQARRTASSSPLGQLFDHGCDAFCTLLTALSASATVQFGSGWAIYTIFSSLLIAFYLAQWEEYHTGVMSCGNGWFGVTEGQLLLIGLHLLAAIFGSQIFHRSWINTAPQLTIANVFIIGFVVSTIGLGFGNIKNVLFSRNTIEKADRGSKQISAISAMLQLVPMISLFIMSLIWIYGSNQQEYRDFPLLFLFPTGISYVLLSTRMIVSHMCKIPFALQLRVLIPQVLVLLNIYLPYLLDLSHSLIRPMHASIIYTLFMVAVYVHYVYNVVGDICNHLNIFLFKIKHQKA